MGARKSGDLGGEGLDWKIGGWISPARSTPRIVVQTYGGVVVHLEGNGGRRFVAFKGVLASETVTLKSLGGGTGVTIIGRGREAAMMMTGEGDEDDGIGVGWMGDVGCGRGQRDLKGNGVVVCRSTISESDGLLPISMFNLSLRCLVRSKSGRADARPPTPKN
jgi:hypothetical protein